MVAEIEEWKIIEKEKKLKYRMYFDVFGVLSEKHNNCNKGNISRKRNRRGLVYANKNKSIGKGKAEKANPN